MAPSDEDVLGAVFEEAAHPANSAANSTPQPARQTANGSSGAREEAVPEKAKVVQEEEAGADRAVSQARPDPPERERESSLLTTYFPECTLSS